MREKRRSVSKTHLLSFQPKSVEMSIIKQSKEMLNLEALTAIRDTLIVIRRCIAGCIRRHALQVINNRGQIKKRGKCHFHWGKKVDFYFIEGIFKLIRKQYQKYKIFYCQYNSRDDWKDNHGQ